MIVVIKTSRMASPSYVFATPDAMINCAMAIHASPIVGESMSVGCVGVT